MDDWEKDWVHIDTVEYSDPTLLEIHVDTRDFHCLLVRKETVYKDIPVDKLKSSGKEYFFTPDEVKSIIKNLHEKSGGDKKWRMLTFGDKSSGWELKYIRIYRTEHGFVMTTREDAKDNFKDREFWKNDPVKPY